MPRPIESLAETYHRIRKQSVRLCEPLEIEDYVVQPMEDASPPKWHLAHVTWFFETFLLKPGLPDYQPFDASFETLFNSYYNGVGKPFPRAKRGFLSRPTVSEVMSYRQHVDAAMANLLAAPMNDDMAFRVTLGLNHEQQHQELLLTDLKYNLGTNPLAPPYVATPDAVKKPAPPLSFSNLNGGIYEIGAEPAKDHFFFDNESPRHRVLIRDVALASRLVTNQEYLAFMDDGGYARAELWLSDAWSLVNHPTEPLQAPLYWQRDGNSWFEYTLGGRRPLQDEAPVAHVSAYEADAYARWAGYRLPTEPEWEVAAANLPVAGNFADSAIHHPCPADASPGLQQMFGDLWEWTQSSYGPYPGFSPFSGALGEYNGKFMANQLVLRGGSCATPADHIRPSYRNFFYPKDRWQFSGIRLASDDYHMGKTV